MFSPYYYWARQRGRDNPENHCAMNVALYGPGSRRWTMTERSSASMQRDAHTLSIGPSAISWDGQALTLRIDEINVPLPRRVRGTIRVIPEGLCSYSAALDDAGRHRWGPIAPCARIEVALDAPALRWSGRAYLDSNEGDEPIDRPFTDWDWSRAVMRDGSTAVIYDVRQKTGADRVLALRFDPKGEVTAFEPPPRRPLPGTLWRVSRSIRSEGEQGPSVTRTLEDTPFYVRSELEAALLGERVTAMHESLSVPRLDSPAVRLMLPWRMPRTR